MPSIIDPAPRGFVGRPLIALLFAVGLGTAAHHMASWFRMFDHSTASTLILTIGVLVGYAWYRFDSLRG